MTYNKNGFKRYVARAILSDFATKIEIWEQRISDSDIAVFLVLFTICLLYELGICHIVVSNEHRRRRGAGDVANIPSRKTATTIIICFICCVAGKNVSECSRLDFDKMKKRKAILFSPNFPSIFSYYFIM